MNADHSGLTLRPYQLLCTICALGADSEGSRNRTIDRIIDAVRQQPDRPLTLRCNAGDVFAFQDPGSADDTPDGMEHNLKRDLEILHKLNMAPGCTLPARIIFNRLWDRIPTVEGICRYSTATASAWQGCNSADADAYERGLARGVKALIPLRDRDEMGCEKKRSMAAMTREPAIAVRPHMLLCSVCQYGGGLRPPFAEDNLPELLQWLLAHPDTPLRMAPQAEWMMCAPCPYRVPDLNACVNNKGSGGLPNQMRDLRVLQVLGLRYGDVIGGREIYTRIFERIPGTLAICRLEQPSPSVWWTGCGAATKDNPGYIKGKTELRKAFGIGGDADEKP